MTFAFAVYEISANLALMTSSSIRMPLDAGVMPVTGSAFGGVLAFAMRLEAVARREDAAFKPESDDPIPATNKKPLM